MHQQQSHFFIISMVWAFQLCSPVTSFAQNEPDQSLHRVLASSATQLEGFKLSGFDEAGYTSIVQATHVVLPGTIQKKDNAFVVNAACSATLFKNGLLTMASHCFNDMNEFEFKTPGESIDLKISNDNLKRLTKEDVIDKNNVFLSTAESRFFSAKAVVLLDDLFHDQIYLYSDAIREGLDEAQLDFGYIGKSGDPILSMGFGSNAYPFQKSEALRLKLDPGVKAANFTSLTNADEARVLKKQKSMASELLILKDTYFPGDSGGGIYFIDENKRFVAVGMVSITLPAGAQSKGRWIFKHDVSTTAIGGFYPIKSADQFFGLSKWIGMATDLAKNKEKYPLAELLKKHASEKLSSLTLQEQSEMKKYFLLLDKKTSRK